MLGALVMSTSGSRPRPVCAESNHRAGKASGTAERFLLFPARRILPQAVALLLTALALAGSVALSARDGILRFLMIPPTCSNPGHSEAASTRN